VRTGCEGRQFRPVWLLEFETADALRGIMDARDAKQHRRIGVGL
jgi:hypothetical protein